MLLLLQQDPSTHMACRMLDCQLYLLALFQPCMHTAPVQVSEVKWIGLQELRQQMEMAPNNFTPWFTGEVWQVAE
jgi:isopentenyldiphosphate isomerase